MMLVISLIDLIIPTSNMKKYIRFILSIFFITVLLHPLMDYKNIEIAGLFMEGMGEEYISEYNVKDIENIQQIQIIDLYKYKVKEEIESVLEEESPVATIKHIEVYIYENVSKKNFGDIHSIEISMGERLEKDTEKRILNNIASRLAVASSKIKIKVLN
ncbi:MAG: stage III sporulation protein AF [Peptostreptococcales bacterium]